MPLMTQPSDAASLAIALFLPIRIALRYFGVVKERQLQPVTDPGYQVEPVVPVATRPAILPHPAVTPVETTHLVQTP